MKKKYNGIKVKPDFMLSDQVDYLMTLPNGSEFVLLYQMICMKCINTNGVLAQLIGDIVFKFDAEKIQRDCKYFKIDTVKEAFRLFLQLEMIYQNEEGYLEISNFEDMVCF